MTATAERLFEGADWDFSTLQRIHDACEEIALHRTRARRLSQPDRGHHRRADAGCLFLGRHAAVLQALVVRQAFRASGGVLSQGITGLAYEIVINSSPCISYLMEENTATMQALVIAHAAFGHNHFFKNNYLFQQWTDADGILDYLDFAKGYVAQCEERHGRLAVEQTLDAAHALMSHGIDRYPGKKKLDLRAEEKRAGERRAACGKRVQRSVAHGADRTGQERGLAQHRAAPRIARAAAGKSAVFPRKDRAAPETLAARIAADRAPYRAVFLSAEPDQGDERRHRDLRALPHHEPPA